MAVRKKSASPASRPQPPEQPSSQVVPFHYVKSTGFRVVIADGAIGGLTPKGRIMFTLYNERAALPRTVEYEVSEAGLGDIVSTDSRGGFVREMEVAVMMDIDAAIGLRDWLSGKIESWEKEISSADGKRKSKDRAK